MNKIFTVVISTVMVLFQTSAYYYSKYFIHSYLLCFINVSTKITNDTIPSAKIIVKLEVKEIEKEIAPGVKYTFWTYGDYVPGKFIRVRVGDEVEFHLSNHPTSKVPHNIDLHAVTGTGGGAASSFTAPGHTSVFNFKVINPGLYIYHCATAPVGMHVANGMYGLIYVETEEGLPPVDKEFYVVQGDFYTVGKNGQQGYQPFSMEKAINETPDYVVFNGSTTSLVGPNALKVNVGETVRIFFGVGGPNLTSSFHPIGEIFDKVYPEGATNVFYENVQTTSVPPGGSSIVEFKSDVPGVSILVDHALTRAFNKGALGQIKFVGPENKTIYSGKVADEVYLPEGIDVRVPVEDKFVVATAPKTKADRIAKGKQLYITNCAACHQTNGAGIENVFPPLAKSDYLNKDKANAIRAVIKGLTGPIVVNGKKYNSAMPALNLNNDEVSNILTFVYNSWGNSNKEVTPEEVEAQRK
ncbi:MAG: copper-containing nitrite reductase [Methylacidiphilales bacterium]|nr:copper-containing nitrite reductase [Candidatus Methylacidiphilales bacterium]